MNDDDNEEFFTQHQPPDDLIKNKNNNTTTTTTTTTANGNDNIPGFENTMPFSVLCAFFEKALKTSKHASKKQLLQKLFSHYKSEEFFPLIRLLLPQLDKERQTYGMKETNLAKFYVEVLGISSESEDALRMINFRRPTANVATTSDTSFAGDFGNAVYLSLKTRCLKSDYSIGDINRCLDELNLKEDRKDKIRVIKRLLRHTTANEQKWLVRIILKELKVGLSEKSVLNYFHENAMDLFNVTSNLRKVCEDLKNPWFKIHDMLAHGTALFRPIKPMLASRYNPEEVMEIMGTHPVVIETKFDGERIQIHKDGNEIKLFTRNSNDCTPIYGGQLLPTIKECVLVDKCILDGELLVWDSLTEKFEDFGRLKSLAVHARELAMSAMEKSDGHADIGNNYGKQLCYIAFDILYIKDNSVMELTLQQRMALLKRCIRIRPKEMEIVEQRPCSTTQDIIDALDQAIMQREEGIIVKNLDSPYVPNERKEKWMKLKPEYVEGVGDDMDLLIIGGFFGTGIGRRGGTISHFLLGVAAPVDKDDNNDNDNNNNNNEPTLFYSMCKVGSGYSDKELHVLQKTLEKYWKPYNPSAPPHCLRLADSFRDKPDVWIDPKCSKILQVKAAQVTPTDKYRAGFTLRFPRVVKIRIDKDWRHCMDISALSDIAKNFEGRYGKRKYDNEDTKYRKKKKGTNEDPEKKVGPRGSKPCNVLSIYQDTDTSSVVVFENLFLNMELCVMSGFESHSKQELETLIVQYGGTKVQNPTPSTQCVISAKEAIKVQNIIKKGSIDVVHPVWIVDCVSHKKVLPFEPKYMLFSTPKTTNSYLTKVDRYGDSFLEDADVNSLKQTFLQVEKQHRPQPARDEFGKIIKNEPKKTNVKDDPEKSSLDESNQNSDPFGVEIDFVDLDQKWFGAKPWWGMFRNFVFYLDQYKVVGDRKSLEMRNSLELISQLAVFYGAKIVDCISDEVTHVIVDKDDKNAKPRLTQIQEVLSSVFQKPPHLARHLVDKQWVLESVTQKEDLDEREYPP